VVTCAHIALVLSVLGVGGAGVIFSMGAVTLHWRRFEFRDIRWRLFWWVSWLSFLVGIALSALFCGFPTNHLALGLTTSTPGTAITSKLAMAT